MLKKIALAGITASTQAVRLRDDNHDPAAEEIKKFFDLNGDGDLNPGEIILKFFQFAGENSYVATAADLEHVFDGFTKHMGEGKDEAAGAAALMAVKASIEKGEHAEESPDMAGMHSAGDVAMDIVNSGYDPSAEEIMHAIGYFGQATQGKMAMSEDDPNLAKVKEDINNAIDCFRARKDDPSKDCSEFEGPTGPPAGHHGGPPHCEPACWANGPENEDFCQTGAMRQDEGTCRFEEQTSQKCHWNDCSNHGPPAGGPPPCEPACWANGPENEPFCQSATMRHDEGACRAEFESVTSKCHWNDCAGPPAGPPPMGGCHPFCAATGPDSETICQALDQSNAGPDACNAQDGACTWVDCPPPAGMPPAGGPPPHFGGPPPMGACHPFCAANGPEHEATCQALNASGAGPDACNATSGACGWSGCPDMPAGPPPHHGGPPPHHGGPPPAGQVPDVCVPSCWPVNGEENAALCNSISYDEGTCKYEEANGKCHWGAPPHCQGPPAGHDQAAHDKAQHDKNAHDQAMHDKNAHDKNAYDQAQFDKNAHDQAMHDAAMATAGAPPADDGRPAGFTGPPGSYHPSMGDGSAPTGPPADMPAGPPLFTAGGDPVDMPAGPPPATADAE